MTTMASQITSLTMVYSTVYSGAAQRKHQSSSLLAFVWNSPVTGEFHTQRASYGENFPFGDVIMLQTCRFHKVLEYWCCGSGNDTTLGIGVIHDDVIKWKHYPRNWAFVRGIHRSREFPAERPVTRSFDDFFDLRPNKRLSINNREAGDLRRNRGHDDVIVMLKPVRNGRHFVEDIFTSHAFS